MGSSFIITIISALKPIYLLPVVYGILIVFFKFSPLLLFSLLLIASLCCYWKKVFIIIRTLPRDLRYIWGISKSVSLARKYQKKDMSVARIFQLQVEKHPERKCFIFGDDVWTYRRVEEYSNKVGNLFASLGYKRGDVVALMLDNRPEYIAIWLGLAKIGVVSALINTSLKGQSLAHCVAIAKAKAVICGQQFQQAIQDCCKGIAMYKYNNNNNGPIDDNNEATNDGFISIDNLIEGSSDSSPITEDPPGYNDKLLYIYTSGTTGLPKAANILNYRYIMGGVATTSFLKLTHNDVIYNCLPLNHTSGGCLGIGPSLICGITTVIRPKFSASSYFQDCIKYKATVGLYIGEMCRYILSVDPREGETKHNLRLMLGNGLRPNVWSQFVKRFQIPQIYEFYGATEGNVNMVNLDNKIGAVGYIPNIIPSSIYPISIIKTDPETCLPIRNDKGFCIRCKPGEPGMFVGIIKQNDPTRKFEGYIDKAESSKKVIKNVFKNGDSAFISGDLVVMDELGYIYFKDRVGDTFRWKGENVSTVEVEAVIAKFTNLQDCVVYGVQIGDMEGRAGMAAIVESNSKKLDLSGLASSLDSSLPPYARPLFIRTVPEVETTSTFKLRKVDLQRLGIDPETSPQEHGLYLRSGNTFVGLTSQIHADLITGKLKV